METTKTEMWVDNIRKLTSMLLPNCNWTTYSMDKRRKVVVRESRRATNDRGLEI